MTGKELNKYKKENRLRCNRRYLENAIIKQGSKCKLCGYSKNTHALVWHHTHDKIINIRSMIHQYTHKQIQTELDKCILICANCHTIIHHNTQ